MIPTTSKSVTLAPYQVLPLAVSGKVFSCAAASAPFLMSVDGGEYFTMQQGWTIDARPDTFKGLTLYNNTAVAIAVTFYVSSSAMFYSPPQTMALVTNAPSYVKGSGILNLPGGQFIEYFGTDNGKVRKQIMVTNLDAAAPLYLQDDQGRAFLPILAGESKTLEFSGYCALNNTNGGAVACVVGETFYA